MPVRLDDLRLFTALPTAHLVLDVDLVVVQANPAYLHLMGVSAAQLIGHHLFEVFPPAPDTASEGVALPSDH